MSKIKRKIKIKKSTFKNGGNFFQENEGKT